MELYCGLCGNRRGVLYKFAEFSTAIDNGGICCSDCRAVNGWPLDKMVVVHRPGTDFPSKPDDNSNEAVLIAALRLIELTDCDCSCNCDDENCCVKQGEYCAKCIATTTLRRVTTDFGVWRGINPPSIENKPDTNLA
jgi:hypothetical protein